jgi:hypothetical protein
MTSIRVEIFTTNGTIDEQWNISRRFALICHMLNKSQNQYIFADNGLLTKSFPTKDNQLTLVVNSEIPLNHEKDFFLTKNMPNDIEDKELKNTADLIMERILEALNKSGEMTEEKMIKKCNELWASEPVGASKEALEQWRRYKPLTMDLCKVFWKRVCTEFYKEDLNMINLEKGEWAEWKAHGSKYFSMKHKEQNKLAGPYRQMVSDGSIWEGTSFEGDHFGIRRDCGASGDTYFSIIGKKGGILAEVCIMHFEGCTDQENDEWPERILQEKRRHLFDGYNHGSFKK